MEYNKVYMYHYPYIYYYCPFGSELSKYIPRDRVIPNDQGTFGDTLLVLKSQTQSTESRLFLTA